MMIHLLVKVMTIKYQHLIGTASCSNYTRGGNEIFDIKTNTIVSMEFFPYYDIVLVLENKNKRNTNKLQHCQVTLKLSF